ncbi:MAG TPA: response regulator [Acidobacteriota bacterium]|jgi:CheY-like chemotaxis protein|nr:response regulator [Acidobacteriota bacterium]
MSETFPQEVQSKNRAVLLVDDEFSIRRVAGAVLEMNGYCVLSASNGAEALLIYQKHQKQIDLVITDWSMPVMNGKACIQEIRKVNLNVPIILVTGSLEEIRDVGMKELGIQALLGKPFTQFDFLKTVESVLESCNK